VSSTLPPGTSTHAVKLRLTSLAQTSAAYQESPEEWSNFTRTESIGKIHIDRNNRERGYWGPLTLQNPDVRPGSVPVQSGSL
jgi:hypothetical protein